MKRVFAAAVAAVCATASFTATAEYVRFSQLQLTGEQYVVTESGMIESNDTVEVKYKTPASIKTLQGIFCNRKNAASQSFTHILGSGSFRMDYGETLHSGNDQGQNTSNGAPSGNTTYTVNMNGATGQWTINGTVQNNSHTPASFTPYGPLVFFALYKYEGTPLEFTLSSTDYYATVVFYYAKIWSSDGTLKHHFVPARDTEQIGTIKEYGLLDIVPDTPVFYTNEGTAAFKVSSSDIVWVGSENGVLSESDNWKGDSGSMVFLSDATATLDSDWTAALGSGRMMVKGENQKTTLNLGSGNVLSLTNNFCVAADGASAEIVSGVVTNASDGKIFVGSESANQNTGFQGCSLAVKNGARFYAGGLNVGDSGKARECEVLVTGEGSILYATMNNPNIGYYEGSASNRLVVADHASAVFEKNLRVGGRESRSSTLRIESGGSVECKMAPYIGYNGTNSTGSAAHSRATRVFVTGEDSTWTATYLYVITGTNDVSDADATEVFVGDGGKIDCMVLMLAGVGSRLVVSNATVSCTRGDGLYTQPTAKPDGVAFTTNSTIRFVGANAKLTTSHLNGNGTKKFGGAEILEFVIPENGWTNAPFRANVAFTIPDGTTLRVDEDSVKAYMKANPRGGTVPLLKTNSASSLITVESMENLAANLPDGCELVNESGVLSVKIPGRTGMAIIFR